MKAVTCLIGMCLLAGLVSADYGWKVGKQYRYKVRGRVMTGIAEIDNQYSGMQMEYEQYITPRMNGQINVKTQNIRVLEVRNTKLEHGWRESKINREHELTIKNKMKQYLGSPMDMTLNHGVVQSIQVQGNLPTWAINMKKAMASVWTLDTTATGSTTALEGNLNRQTNDMNVQEANQDSGFFFETVEKTVHGECETYYTVSQNGPFDVPFPFQQSRDARQESTSASGSSSQESQENQGQQRNSSQSASASSESNEVNGNSGEKPWPKAFHQLCQQNDQIYEIIKTVNFTACNQKPVLAYSSPVQAKFHPGDNAGGNLWQRALISRYLTCGTSRQNYTILKVDQQERFYNGLQDLEKVFAGAQKNVTLISITHGSSPPKIQNPKTINNLVYTFDPEEQELRLRGKFLLPHPADSAESSQAGRKPMPTQDGRISPDSLNDELEIESSESSENSGLINNNHQNPSSRFGRLNNDVEKCEHCLPLPQPNMTHPSLSPMMITRLNREGIIKRVNELMEMIVNELTTPTEGKQDSIAKREVLSKISIVVKALRVLETKSIHKLVTKWVVKGQSDKQQVGRSIFLDALAIAGTNPCVNYLLWQIKEYKIQGEEAAQILSTLPMYIRTPTEELLDLYFTLMDMKVKSQQVQVKTTVMLSFSTLIYNACLNKKIRNTRYPVALYGEFCSARVNEYVICFIKKLERRLQVTNRTQEDNHWIITLLASIGNLGHPDTIDILQKVLDHEIDPVIKVKAVYAFKHLVQSRSNLNVNEKVNGKVVPIDRQSVDILTDEVIEQQVLPVLVTVAFDRGEHPEVRNAAYSLLFYCTYADVAIWQQIAMSTWFEQSRNVRSFVVSSLRSFANLESPNQPVGWVQRRKALAVLPLVKNIDASILRSHNIHTAKFVEGLNTGFAQHFQFFESEDSIVPNYIYYKNIFNLGNGGVRFSPLEISLGGNTIQKLANAFINAVTKGDSVEDLQKHDYMHKIHEKLNIKARNQTTPVLGALFVDLKEEMQRLWTFDDKTMADLAKMLVQGTKKANGMSFNINYQKAAFMAQAVHSMPTIMGFPLEFSMRMPAIVSIRGVVKLQNTRGWAVQADLAPVYAWKIHNKLSFKCPFTGKNYQAGVQRHFVVEAPFTAVSRKAPSAQLELAITPAQLGKGAPQGTVDLVTYHQRPYTAVIHDEFWPSVYPKGGKMEIVRANLDQNHQQQYQGFQATHHFGQKALGLALSLHEESDYPRQKEQMSGWAHFVRQFHSANCFFNAAWLGSPSIRFAERKIVLDISESQTKTILIQLAVRNKFIPISYKLASSEENQSQESQESAQGSAEQNLRASRRQSGSESSSSSESKEGKGWFHLFSFGKPTQRPHKNAQKQNRQQQQSKFGGRFGGRRGQSQSAEQSQSQSNELNQSSESAELRQPYKQNQASDSQEQNFRRSGEHFSFFSSEELSASQEGQPKRGRLQGRQQVGTVVAIAVLGKKAPLVSLYEYNGEIRKQHPLVPGKEKTVQYLLQVSHNPLGKMIVRASVGNACKSAAENIGSVVPDSEAMNAIVKQILASSVSQHVESCFEFQGTLNTPKLASRHIVAVRRHTLLKLKSMKMELDGKILFGSSCHNMPYRIKIEGNLHRDQEMKEWAHSKSPEAKKCLRDEKKGFEISQICMDVAEQQAAAVNVLDITVTHKVPVAVQNASLQFENVLKALYYPYMSEDVAPRHAPAKHGTILIKGRMTPNKQFISLQIRKPNSILAFNDVIMNKLGKTLLPLTATQTLYGNVKDRLLRSKSDPMCSIQNNYVNTFDNVTYSFHKEAARGCQHVLVKDCSGRYPMAVLVNHLNKKERVVTVLLGDKTKIQIIPRGQQVNTHAGLQASADSPGMTVLVNDEKHSLPFNVPVQNQGRKRPVAQIMHMPNGGVQLIGRRIQVATDGERVIVYVDNAFRNRTCGLCGDFDGEKVAEMRSPQDVPLSSGTLLVASYAFDPLDGSGKCKIDQQVKRHLREEESQRSVQQDRYLPRGLQRGHQYAQAPQQYVQQQRRKLGSQSSSSSSSSSEERQPGQQRNQSSSSSSSSEERYPGQQRNQSSSSSSSSSEERKPGQQGKQSSSSSSSSEERKPGQQGRQSSSSSSSSSEERKPGQQGKQSSSSSSSSSEERKPGQQGKQSSSSSSSSSEERKPGQKGKQSSSSSSSSSEERKPGQKGKQSSSSSSSSSEERRPGQQGKQSSSSSSEERKPGQQGKQSSSSSSSSEERKPGQQGKQSSSSSSSEEQKPGQQGKQSSSSSSSSEERKPGQQGKQSSSSSSSEEQKNGHQGKQSSSSSSSSEERKHGQQRKQSSVSSVENQGGRKLPQIRRRQQSQSSTQKQYQQSSAGMKQQQVVMHHPQHSDKLCFSLSKLHVCEQEYEPKYLNQKNLPFYCVQEGSQAQQIKDQIHAGQFRDFSGKPMVHFRVPVPQQCVRV